MTPEDRKLFFEGAIRHGNLGRAFYEVACEFAGPNHEAFTIKVFYEAIHAAQAEQRRKDAEFVRTHTGAWSSVAPHNVIVEHRDAATEVLAKAILAQEGE